MIQDRQARLAALVLACASAGAQLAASAADAWFLAAIGPRHLGTALAASSLLVAITLALVGAASDRRDRRRTLIGLCAAGAVLLPALDLAHRMGASAAAIASMIIVKQLQAAVDLAFWVAIAERFDARTARRLVPWLSAAGGVGAVIGAALVVPLAHVGGASAALVTGAGVMALAAVLSSRMDPSRRFGAVAAAPSSSSLRWSAGWDQLQRQPLARGLALVVALGGAFASLAYFVLGADAAARYPDSAGLAQFLGAVRAVSQAAMLLVQLVIAPRVLSRAGVGGALVVAPIGAVAASIACALFGGLPSSAVVQVQARVLDGSIDAPAQKLAQNLLPAEVRGRVGGFLDGVAKRAGAIGGGLAATALLAWPDVLHGALVAVAIGWALGALLLRARLPGWALEAVGGPGVTGADPDDEVILGDRAARQVIAGLEQQDPAMAAELAARLHHAGAIDARPVIASLLAKAPPEEQAAVATALWSCARGRDPSTARAIAAVVPRLTDDAAEWVARAAGVLGRDAGIAIEGARVGAAGGRRDAVIEVALSMARARVLGNDGALDGVLDRALEDEDPDVQAAGVRELAVEVGLAAADVAPAGVATPPPTMTSMLSMRRSAGETSYRTDKLPAVPATIAPPRTPTERAFELGRRLLRITRRGRPGAVDDRARAVVAIGELGAVARDADSAEAILFRTEAFDLCRRLADRRHEPAPAPVAAAALAALAAWRPLKSEDVHLLADALGDRDDDVREAAATVLRSLGADVAPDLARAAGFGRRAARDRALALLRELPVTTTILDRLVAAELDALDGAALRSAALSSLRDPWIVRRLGERLDEIGHTSLLLIAAREKSSAIATGARLFRLARGKDERARALEALDAALPRAVAIRILPTLETGDLPSRARGASARGDLPRKEAAVRVELAGADPLLRGLLVRALGAERARYRSAIADAARAAAAEVSPLDLLRRITLPDDDAGDVPAAVEKMVLLSSLPLLGELTTPQIAALAERAQVVDLAEGETLHAEGERLDSLVIVADGELAVGDRTVATGQAVDELAPMAPRPLPASIVARAATRVVRVARVDFEELVDDEPGLAAALLRHLGERLRT
ncbi:MAG TPA: cyclic nucleotide-binding domain-containing protein [Kofleriaceae bacterium]|nr:cyclic nucleotide-binding domain-containing protein [Kofleriaceae bacterium]